MSLFMTDREVEAVAKLANHAMFDEFLGAVTKMMEHDTQALINDPTPQRAGRCQAWTQLLTEIREVREAFATRETGRRPPHAVNLDPKTMRYENGRERPAT